MAERKERTCCVCRDKYKFCNLCGEDRDKPLWYFTFCSENCHDIYKITSEFENGNISDLDAKEQLKKMDLSKKENFGESYQKSIKKIMKAKSIRRVEIKKELDEGEPLVELANVGNEAENIE